MTPPTRDDDSSTMLEGIRALAAEAPVSLHVSGQCMEPVIADQADIRIAARRRYWPGDILAFRSHQGELRVHRLIGYRRRDGRLLFQTRADASGTLDKPVADGDVIGRVVGTPGRYAPSLAERILALYRFFLLWGRGDLGR